MAAWPCPQCGAPVAFRSTDLPVKVCDYCRTSILRDDAGLRAMGSAATVPDDVSPLRLGTRGSDLGLSFELIGRVRWRWDDGGWNEWLALFADGSHAWLGEAMGRIMMLRPVPPAELDADSRHRLAADDALAPGTTATIAGMDYRVTDVRRARVVASEGELPLPAPAGLEMLSFDLQTGQGRCASIQREGDAIKVYAGRFTSLSALHLAGLRRFEDWPLPDWASVGGVAA